jgi:hypothetical protein
MLVLTRFGRKVSITRLVMIFVAMEADCWQSIMYTVVQLAEMVRRLTAASQPCVPELLVTTIQNVSELR